MSREEELKKKTKIKKRRRIGYMRIIRKLGKYVRVEDGSSS